MSFVQALRPPLVGLDIGSTFVRAVVLRRARSGWTLTAATEVPLPPEPTPAAEIPDPLDLAGAVRQALDGLRRRLPVAAALPGQVIVKRLALPVMTRRELAEAISWEAEQSIPFDLADVQLDYQVLDSGPKASGSTMDVLLVAARKDRIEDRAALVRHAGHRPVVMDVEAFAIVNAYRVNYPEHVDPLAAVLHIGRTATIVCLMERGQLACTRDISLGGREISAQLVREIHRTVDFYRATASVDRLARVVLSGGACGAEGLADLLRSELAAPVEILNPFRRVARPARALACTPDGPAYAVAVGLALRRLGDR